MMVKIMGILRDMLHRFRKDERGVVTTDYIFMTAMMMGTSISVTSGVVNGSVETSTRLGAQIEFVGRAALNNDYNALSGFTFGGRTVTTDPQPGTDYGNSGQTDVTPEPEPEPEAPSVFEPQPSTLSAKQTDRWTENIAGRTDTKLANLVRNQLNKAAKGDKTSMRRSIAGMAIVEMQARGMDTSLQERWYNDVL